MISTKSLSQRSGTDLDSSRAPQKRYRGSHLAQISCCQFREPVSCCDLVSCVIIRSVGAERANSAYRNEYTKP
jgi:hypothetical protein